MPEGLVSAVFCVEGVLARSAGVVGFSRLVRQSAGFVWKYRRTICAGGGAVSNVTKIKRNDDAASPQMMGSNPSGRMGRNSP